MQKTIDKPFWLCYDNITMIPVHKKVGDYMKLADIASVRTGAVTGRKRAEDGDNKTLSYRMLNLKCLAYEGYLELNNAEDYKAKERIKPDFFTRKGDILIRLSYPYTSVLIKDKEAVGFLVPSHFAIIRVDKDKVLPEYILWYLKRDSVYQQILLNSSGSTALGTISSGFISSLDINVLSKEKQKILGQLLVLANREQELLLKLAKEKSVFNREALNIIYNNFKGE